MINKRKILALIILLAGVGVSVSIINSDDTENKDVTASTSGTESNPSFDFNNLKEENAKLNLPEQEERKEENKEVSAGSEDANLTESLADTYARDILKKSSGKELPSEEEAVAELKENTSQGFNYQTFDEKDIRVSSDNSQENQMEYVKAVDKAIWDSFGNMKNKNTATALEEFFKNNNPRVLNNFIEATPGYIDALLQMEVPETMKTLHLDMLNLWSKKLSIYKAVVNYDSDPFRGYLASQEVPNTIRKSQDIQSILIQRYNELTKS